MTLLYKIKATAEEGRNTGRITVIADANIIIIIYRPLLGLGRYFQFLALIHSRYDSLDGGWARRKVSSYTQNNTNTE
jgi:hypothetical protein